MKRTIKGLLEDYFCIPTVQTQTRYERIQDDCMGDYSQTLSVIMGPDGDMWIKTKGTIRFRETSCGGGRSHRTRNALMLLAEAIRLDNEDSPFGDVQASNDGE